MGDDIDGGASPLRGADGDTFAALLDRLKRRGTTVLVVGDLSADVELAMSRRMMGHPHESRYRLLALLRSAADAADWFPDGVSLDEQWVDVLDYGGLARDAATTAPEGVAVGPGGTPSGDDPSAVAPSGPEPGGGDLPDPETVLEDVEAWVERVDREADPAPGEIRVGVAPLDVLLDEDRSEDARAVVESLHDTMRRHRGVAHLYLLRDRSSDVVQDISVWVDVVVEVRSSGGRPEQRWMVQDTVSTSWFPIRDDEPHHRPDR